MEHDLIYNCTQYSGYSHWNTIAYSGTRLGYSVGPPKRLRGEEIREVRGRPQSITEVRGRPQRILKVKRRPQRITELRGRPKG